MTVTPSPEVLPHSEQVLKVSSLSVWENKKVNYGSRHVAGWQEEEEEDVRLTYHRAVRGFVSSAAACLSTSDVLDSFTLGVCN